MKPTDFSHEELYFRLHEPPGNEDLSISWKTAENVEKKLKPPGKYCYNQDQESRGHCTSSSFMVGIRTETLDDASEEVFDNVQPIDGSSYSWSTWKGHEIPRRLPRSRSLIRTNPWVGSTSDSPPWSPSEWPLYRCWSVLEPGITSPEEVIYPRTPTNMMENEAGISSSSSSKLFRRDDSLLTTSVESDSLRQSMTSDTDTVASQMSVSDVGCTQLQKDRQLDDVMSYDSIQTNSSSYSSGFHSSCDDVVFESGEFNGRGSKSRSSSQFCDQGKRDCNTKSKPFRFNLELKRPSFGGRRFSDIADEYEAELTTRSKSVVEIKHLISKSDTKNFRKLDQTEMDLSAAFVRKGTDALSYDTSPSSSSSFSSSSSSSLQFRRKMLAVRSSLQEKVAMLRREKKMVDDKIREAKEEEKIRLHQLEKFRHQLSQTRKQILLRTLEEIKGTLQEQCLKLQKLYDIVLVEQRRLLCCQ